MTSPSSLTVSTSTETITFPPPAFIIAAAIVSAKLALSSFSLPHPSNRCCLSTRMPYVVGSPFPLILALGEGLAELLAGLVEELRIPLGEVGPAPFGGKLRYERLGASLLHLPDKVPGVAAELARARPPGHSLGV